jgi:hypothetical protein
MKKIIPALAFVLALTSCKKEDRETIVAPSQPAVIYTDWGKEVRYRQSQSLDIDQDGVTDFTFNVLHVGDPVLQRDRIQFYAHSGIGRNLLNDAADHSPVLNQSDLVSPSHPGYTWYELSAIVLTEKIITDNASYWDGLWKNASHQYLPLQVVKEGRTYHGWIELSMDTAAERLTIHRSGLSTEADVAVKAGL